MINYKVGRRVYWFTPITEPFRLLYLDLKSILMEKE